MEQTSLTETYDKIRQWRRTLDINSQQAQLACTTSESKEWAIGFEDKDEEEMKDAIGDMAVVAVVHYDIRHGNDRKLEDQLAPFYKEHGNKPKYLFIDERGLLIAQGMMGEGIRKEKFVHELDEGCIRMLAIAIRLADKHGFNFSECLNMVVGHLYERLENIVMVNGSAIKKEDQL